VARAVGATSIERETGTSEATSNRIRPQRHPKRRAGTSGWSNRDSDDSSRLTPNQTADEVHGAAASRCNVCLRISRENAHVEWGRIGTRRIRPATIRVLKPRVKVQVRGQVSESCRRSRRIGVCGWCLPMPTPRAHAGLADGAGIAGHVAGPSRESGRRIGAGLRRVRTERLSGVFESRRTASRGRAARAVPRSFWSLLSCKSGGVCPS